MTKEGEEGGREDGELKGGEGEEEERERLCVWVYLCGECVCVWCIVSEL